MGQLIRNSPIAFDADQKADLVKAGFSLSRRIVTFLGDISSISALQSQALNELREKVLKSSNRAALEAELAGVLYKLAIFFVFFPIRHACFYLAHRDLTLIYEQILLMKADSSRDVSLSVLACGLAYELRLPDPDLLGETYKDLTPAGRDLLQMWTWLFLSFNRVSVSKRQRYVQKLWTAGAVKCASCGQVFG